MHEAGRLGHGRSTVLGEAGPYLIRSPFLHFSSPWVGEGHSQNSNCYHLILTGLKFVSLLPISLHDPSFSQSLPMRFQLSPLSLLLFHIFIFTSPFIVSAQCHEDQKNALLQIFSSYSALPSWTSNKSDCCLWDGITCDNATGLVISLDVANRSISGSINSSILASLSSLQSLNLSYNYFNSSIPPNLDSLSNLTHLNLSYSGFTGQIPCAIAHMRNLVSLDISTFFLGNHRTSLKLKDPSIEKLLRNLSGLTKLHLDGVNISSAVPEFLSGFTNLTCLRLSSCRLQGNFPAKIFQLPKLEFLDVSGNPFLNGSFPEFPRENALQTLVLTGSRFSGELPHSFGNLTRLNKLQIGGCEFFGQIPYSVENIRGIVHLDLSSNGFNGSIPSLENLSNLTYLDLSMNNFSGTIPSLESLTELVLLDVSWNAFSGPIPPLKSLKSVAEIVLSSNNLTGTIPNSFGDGLHKLKLLDLRSNSLHGQIPSSLFTLPSLQALQLRQNQLAGQLDEFTNASRTLQTVDLSDNQLQGQIPHSLFDLVGLKVLDLSSNNFNGTVQLAMLQNLKNLSGLDLSDNYLSVNTHGTNHSFPQLGRLYLGSCNLTEFPEFLKNQSKMQFLDLSKNNIYREIPRWLWEIGNGYLTSLNLSHNLLMSLEQPGNLSSIKMLVILDLHSNRLQGSIPLPPPSIIVQDYSHNSFTSVILSNFNSLKYTVFFSIAGNKIVGEIPPSICNATYLQVLDLSNNNLNGSIPECLIEISNVLSILNLRNNRFTGIIPEISGVSCSLRTLDLHGNRLQGQLPRSLAKCTDLEVLDVGNNQINGPFPCYLDTLSKLRVLVLRSNRFNGSIPWPYNQSFPMLQIIDLSSNLFSGNLPQGCFQNWNAMMSGEKDEDQDHEVIRYGFLNLSNLYYQDTVMVTSKGLDMELVKILTIFTSIDLSNNHFEGEIPNVIGDLKLLHILNLSRNGLTGPIPASLGNLRMLESLDLSQNNLSGVIPQQLSRLTFLSVLDLSHNRLVGSIPLANQFLTFTNDSFIGNLGLCGPPLSRKCAPPSAPPPMVVKAADSSASRFDWQLIFIGLGFGGGLGMFAGPLVFWTKGRRWYNKHIDRVVLMIFPSGVFDHLNCDEPRIEAEEQVDQDCTENTTDSDGEEEKCHQRFCVFCTQVDARWERAIHKECSCLDISPPFSSPQSRIPEATPD
ncbi:receptor-like protein 33 [Magnolia sinica]|uniref:receptor-like protein 33 n=1 Tax=Magnolia sinica TaxID=86752 RepID=UPI00265A6851|nr:receptor-like protein 33 [Magnolia sinica]